MEGRVNTKASWCTRDSKRLLKTEVWKNEPRVHLIGGRNSEVGLPLVSDTASPRTATPCVTQLERCCSQGSIR